MSRILVDLNPATGPKDAPVNRPRVTDTQSGRVLLDLWDTWEWDAYVVRNDGGLVTLRLRSYPGTVEGGLTIDADAGTYAIRPRHRWWAFRAVRQRLRAAGLKRS